MDEAAVLRYVIDSFPGVNPLSAAGDTYFLYDPDRDLPPNRQHPFSTLVTGDRHDRVSQLDRPGVYRLNIGVRKQTYRDLFGRPPTERGDGGRSWSAGGAWRWSSGTTAASGRSAARAVSRSAAASTACNW